MAFDPQMSEWGNPAEQTSVTAEEKPQGRTPAGGTR